MRAQTFTAILLLTNACHRANRIGDRVMVDLRGADTPAVIVGLETGGRVTVHYEGFGDDWDETVPETRIRGSVSGTTSRTGVPSIRHATVAGNSISDGGDAGALPSVYRVGDHVRVEWHGAIYGASVIDLVDSDRYRLHYDGFGSEWDETVGLNRIQRK